MLAAEVRSQTQQMFLYWVLKNRLLLIIKNSFPLVDNLNTLPFLLLSLQMPDYFYNNLYL